jgi:hypothetical protein
MNEKFNRLMPESEGATLCYELSKPISKEGYEDNFLAPALQLVHKYGELRLLMHYTNYQGWEQEAAEMDIAAHVELGRYMKKMALVNAPDKEIMSRMLKKSLNHAELRFFKTDQLEEAIKWVKS